MDTATANSLKYNVVFLKISADIDCTGKMSRILPTT